jgi:hypothetical protein
MAALIWLLVAQQRSTVEYSIVFGLMLESDSFLYLSSIRSNRSSALLMMAEALRSPELRTAVYESFRGGDSRRG